MTRQFWRLQGWYWEEPYEPWNPDIDGHTESDATTNKDKDMSEVEEERECADAEEKDELLHESNGMRWTLTPSVMLESFSLILLQM